MTGRRARPLDASMGLLNDMANQALEPDYADAAARRARGTVPAPTAAVRGVRTATVLLLAVVLGTGVMWAVLQLRTPGGTGESPRELLAREIEHRTAEADELAQARDALDAELTAMQASALAADPDLLARVQEAELASGAVPVRGPGLVVVLEDGPGAAGEDGDPEARVQDVDLQVLTNGLWAAGAEAISVNGQRITSLSAIRSAGDAILVDLAPVLAPYRVEAIGDVRGMQTAFARSAAASHLTYLTQTYGIAVNTSSAQDLRLPGSPSTTLRHAKPIEDVASSEGSDGEGSP